MRPRADGAKTMESPEFLFISDLHLSNDNPRTVELFLQFLAGRAHQAERLYILGDLFDAWIGDDDDASLNTRIITALRDLSDSGVKLFLQHGNRDFLLGRRFLRSSGCRLLKDPHREDLFGTPTLLMHGDLLCTDDVPYQKFRRKVRNPLVQWLFLRRSLKKRRAQAAEYRRASGEAKSEKTADIMDVNQDTVREYMIEHKVDRLIHGHTHRPACHDLSIDGRQAQRWVLAEWRGGSASALSLRQERMEVIELA